MTRYGRGFNNQLSIQLARDLLHQCCCARQQGQTMSTKGPFDGQDRIKIGLDKELDKNMI
jgi:hypothetical protein